MPLRLHEVRPLNGSPTLLGFRRGSEPGRQPGFGVLRPERTAVGAVVEPEDDAGDPCSTYFSVEPLVLGAEEAVVRAHVEGEMSVAAGGGQEVAESRDERVSVGPVVGFRRAEIDRGGAGRIGRLEVAAP